MFAIKEEKSASAAGSQSGRADRLVQLKKQLFFAVGPARSSASTTLQYLLALAKQPVSATRHAAVDLLRAAAAQRAGHFWGATALFQGDSFARCSLSSLSKD